MSKRKIRRFTVTQRLFHILLVVSFMTQTATGCARLFIETAWGKGLATLFGGYDGALVVHKVSGTFMVLLFLCHLVYLAVVIDWKRFPKSVLGPDSLVPSISDCRDFFQHIGWFLGLAEEPKFERWAYYEKFGYWAVFWGVVMFGVTGYMLFDPVATARVLPGWTMNLALYLHREEMELAVGYLFIAHFFVSHFRPRRFPMDRVIFDGTLDYGETLDERPAWVGRMERQGLLPEGMIVSEPSKAYRIASFAFGYFLLAFGIFLLIFGVLNIDGITW
ncbi:MAG TPA: cytochrome C [Syntrophobacteraceae bacterium]|nr:cytochrome C [Syntrophobacteraceae bacterium]HBD09061.1 cytochrome C [Syntrophobacteraceae bacterium]